MLAGFRQRKLPAWPCDRNQGFCRKLEEKNLLEWPGCMCLCGGSVEEVDFSGARSLLAVEETGWRRTSFTDCDDEACRVG